MKRKINNIKPRKIAGLLFNTLVAFLLLFTVSSCGNKQKSGKTNFSKSLTVNDSIELLTGEIKQDSADASLWKKRAGLFLKNGNIDAAFRDLNKALEINRNDPELFILLSDIYFTLGDEKASISSIKKAIDLNPNNPDYYLKMAKFKLLMQKYETALAFADKVLTMDPENAQAFYIKAVSNLEQKDTANALKMMMVAANTDTSFFAANLNVAVLLDEKNDSTAVIYYKKALRNKPANLIAEYSLALFYQELGQYKKALQTYKNLVSKHPEHAQSYYNQGYIYLTEFLNYPKALEMFNKAIEANPNYTEAVYNLGRTYEAMGDTIKAMEKYRQALKLTTNYPLAIEGLNRLEE